jgi:hypothetical protein
MRPAENPFVVLQLFAATAISAGTGTVLVDNTGPRLDEHGAIVNTHQGSMIFDRLSGKYYWMGSAFLPCKNQQPASRGSGCVNMSWGACGFDNNGWH